MSTPVKFDWATYYFPDNWDLYDILHWLNERMLFAKQMKEEKGQHEDTNKDTRQAEVQTLAG